MSTLPIQIRWLMRADMIDVMNIEEASFEHPWCYEDFLSCLRQRNCIGMVAEILPNLKTAGFMIYELNKGRLDLLNFAVDVPFRRRGVGSQMVERLVDKLSQQQRTQIAAIVRERNLEAQLFFRNQQFRVVAQLPHHFEDCEEDGYEFLYRKRVVSEISPFHPSNRGVGEYLAD